MLIGIIKKSRIFFLHHFLQTTPPSITTSTPPPSYFLSLIWEYLSPPSTSDVIFEWPQCHPVCRLLIRQRYCDVSPQQTFPKFHTLSNFVMSFYLRKFVNYLVIYPWNKRKFVKCEADFSSNFTIFLPWISLTNLS